MRHSILGLALAVALPGCATSSTTAGPTGGGIVHLFQQGQAGGHANCYWFETPSGPVVVDVPLTVTETKRLAGGMVHPYRIYITAAKAERFGGVETLRVPDVPVLTSPAVATEIKNHGDVRLAKARSQFGDDVPSHAEPPSPAIEERTHDLVGEVEVELIPLGPAESEASLALFLPKTGELIAGDVVAGHEHVDLTWGRSVVWQDRIAELKALEPKLVYPGHGTPGGPELLDETLAYLKFFHETVAARVKPGAPARISSADLASIKQQVTTRFPLRGRPELLDKSVPAEYAVQLAALPPAPVAEPGAATATAPSSSGDAKTNPPVATPAPTHEAPPPAATTTSKTTTSKSSTLSTGTGIDDLLGADTGSSKKKKKKK